MSEAVPAGGANRLLSLGGLLDDVCDQVEAAWKAGQRPRIEDHLGDTPEPGRSALLRELLVLELGYRDRAGDRPKPEDYLGRFPEHAGLIEAILFEETDRRNQVGDPPATRQANADSDDGPARASLEAGAGSRYDICRPHARGGLGEVFVAHDRELGREVAIKRIQAGHADHPESRARFVREAEITGRLEHPGIVPVYGLGRNSDGRPFYAMRFIHGKTLKEAIQQFHEARVSASRPGERIVALRKLLRHFLDVCNAVDYAHSRGVMHRDLKPANVMLGPYGETLVVDWGLAKPIDQPDPRGDHVARPSSALSVDDATLTKTGVGLGTPAYMSPEQAEGRWNEVGPASDVFSLGAMLHTILSGRSPFAGRVDSPVPRQTKGGAVTSLRSVVPGVLRPLALEAISRKAMAPRPEDRYTSPRALAEDLEHWLADEPVAAAREGWRQRLARWARRHGQHVALSFLLLLLLAVVVGATAWNASERKNTEIANHKADQEASLAAMATQEAESHQYHSILNTVRANRGQIGWTRTGLEAIRTAAGLETTSRDLLELRNEAADCLMAVDLQRRPTPVVERFNVGRLAFSPDGKVIAVAEKEANSLFFGRVLLYDTNTLLFIKEFKYIEKISLKGIVRPNGPERVESMLFSPDGRWLAVGMRFGRVCLWEWDQPDPRPVIWNAHRKKVGSLVFNRDGKTLWTGSEDAIVKRWDISAVPREAQTEAAAFDLGSLNNGNAMVRDLVVGQDTLWASLGWGDTDSVASLDPQTLKPNAAQLNRKACLALGHELCLSPDRRMLAGAVRNVIRLMDAKSAAKFREVVDTSIDISHDLDSGRNHQTLQFSPDGSLLATSPGSEGFIGLWDVAAARVVARISMLNSSIGNSAFSPDGRYLAVPDDQSVVLYELLGRDLARTAPQNCSLVSDFDWSGDGRSLIWIAGDGRQFEVTVAPAFEEGEPVRKSFSKAGITTDWTYIASHPRELVLAIQTDDTYLWDYGRSETPTRIGVGFVGPMAFTRDGSRLWGVARGESIDSWPLSPALGPTHWHDTSGSLSIFIEHSPLTIREAVGGFEGVAGITAGARWVLAAGRDGRTRVLNARDGTIQAMWDNGTDSLSNPVRDPGCSVALSSDGTLGASGMRSGRIWLRRVPGGEEVVSLQKHRGAVDALAFHPHGRVLASGSRDGTVRLWQPVHKTWSEVLTLRAPRGPVRRLRYSPDGTKLAVLVQNETAVRIWDLASLRSRLAAMHLDWEDDEGPTLNGHKE